jgi:hypothetical protein
MLIVLSGDHQAPVATAFGLTDQELSLLWRGGCNRTGWLMSHYFSLMCPAAALPHVSHCSHSLTKCPGRTNTGRSKRQVKDQKRRMKQFCVCLANTCSSCYWGLPIKETSEESYGDLVDSDSRAVLTATVPGNAMDSARPLLFAVAHRLLFMPCVGYLATDTISRRCVLLS